MSEPFPHAEEEVLSDLAHKLFDLAKDIADDPKIAAAIQKAKYARAQLLQDINAKIWLRGMPRSTRGQSSAPPTRPFCGSVV